MTTTELIRALREQTNTNGCWNDGCWNKCKRLMNEAAKKRFAAGEAEGLEIEGKLRIMKSRRLEKRKKGK